MEEPPDLVDICDESSCALAAVREDVKFDVPLAPFLPDQKRQRTQPVPLTILTGWLGAGKTTLLQYILKSLQNEGKKVAIIQNEFSNLGVETALRVEDDTGLFGEVVELGGGCVCCSVRSDMAVALTTLVSKRLFDLVIIECSGLANPGTLAAMFWVDHELESGLYLDSIVCVTDARHLPSHLEISENHSTQVIHQLSFADVILLNKQDLSTPEASAALHARLRDVNGIADILLTTRSQVDLTRVLNIRAFDQVQARPNHGLQTLVSPHPAPPSLASILEPLADSSSLNYIQQPKLKESESDGKHSPGEGQMPVALKQATRVIDPHDVSIRRCQTRKIFDCIIFLINVCFCMEHAPFCFQTDLQIDRSPSMSKSFALTCVE